MICHNAPQVRLSDASPNPTAVSRGAHVRFLKKCLLKWHLKTNWAEILRQSNYPTYRRLACGPDGGCIGPASGEKEGWDVEQELAPVL